MDEIIRPLDSVNMGMEAEMQAIRKIFSKTRRIEVDLPVSWREKSVEVIILPVEEDEHQEHSLDSMKNLDRAFGPQEPEYGIQDIREGNRRYEGR